MRYYAGLDVSLEETAICIVDEVGKIERELRAESEPDVLAVWLRDIIGVIKHVADLDREIARRAKDEGVPTRLMTIPGIGPTTATAIAALAPPIETFRKGRDFAA